jgi:hypothetical protein
VSDTVNEGVISHMLRAMCPSIHLPNDEFEKLVGFIVTVMEQRDKYEAQVSLLQRATVKARTTEAQSRDVLLQFAQFIPDAAAEVDDESSVEMWLPGHLARPLCLVGQEHMLAETVAHLSKKKVKPSALGVAYVNDVSCVGDSPKAIYVVDQVTQDKFWVPKSQIVYGESEVTQPGQTGALIVSKWIAEQKGWLPQS